MTISLDSLATADKTPDTLVGGFLLLNYPKNVIIILVLFLLRVSREGGDFYHLFI